MRMGKRQQAAHKAFLDLYPGFEPTEVYEVLCRLLKLNEEAIERGLGKLFKEGKLKTKERAKHKAKHSRSSRPDDFR